MSAPVERIDVNVFLGAYPFRRVPGTTPEALLAAMDRVGTSHAWVTHLPSLFWKDPAEGNGWLYHTCEQQARFLPVPSVQPELAHWQEILKEAGQRNAPAIRCDPMFQAVDPTGPAMQALVAACGETGLALMMATKLEDGRQRHPNDVAGDLPPSAVRTLIRGNREARFIITHADRAFIEEVHFGSTPEEASRIWWDISWIWGPPEDHLATLIRTVGPDRFVFGTGMPLRLPETSVAKLDLLTIPREIRSQIESGNARLITGGKRKPNGK